MQTVYPLHGFIGVMKQWVCAQWKSLILASHSRSELFSESPHSKTHMELCESHAAVPLRPNYCHLLIWLLSMRQGGRTDFYILLSGSVIGRDCEKLQTQWDKRIPIDMWILGGMKPAQMDKCSMEDWIMILLIAFAYSEKPILSLWDCTNLQLSFSSIGFKKSLRI